MEFFCKYNVYFLNSQQINHPIFRLVLMRSAFMTKNRKRPGPRTISMIPTARKSKSIIRAIPLPIIIR